MQDQAVRQQTQAADSASNAALSRAELAESLKMCSGSFMDFPLDTDEGLIQGLFVVFRHATKHSIAAIIKRHGSLVHELMSSEYAIMLDD